MTFVFRKTERDDLSASPILCHGTAVPLTVLFDCISHRHGVRDANRIPTKSI
jgi:hypothetical protein